MKLFTLAAVALIAGTSVSHAANIITWAGPGTDAITAVNDGLGSTTITGTDVGITVGQILGGPATPFSAFLNLTATSTDTAVPIGSSVLQHYFGSFSITSGAGGTGVNFLSGTFTDSALGAGAGLTLTASEPPDLVSFTSDIISATDLATPRSVSFAFSNVSPIVSIVNGSINSFTASHSGTASASPAAIPEPASVALLGAGILGLGVGIRRRSKG